MELADGAREAVAEIGGEDKVDLGNYLGIIALGLSIF
jgi:hypothetical protein